MIWRIDPTSGAPVYLQLVSQVHVALARGDLTPGERLPSARELAESLELNMHTVLHAYQQLRDDGVIELRRGRGAVVVAGTAHGRDHVRTTLAAYAAAARDAGLSPEAAVALLKEEMLR
ncbi:MAG: GntR family transcriptional regulator [Promicromonosporaceae bacterium]|nr:GntR family transcriptional regulator [Promicromonosporaceae bacterium]